jgi:hypothetical protein
MTIQANRPLAIGKKRKKYVKTCERQGHCCGNAACDRQTDGATRSHHHKRIITTSMDETNCAGGRLRDFVARWRNVQIVSTEMHHLYWGARSSTWRYNKGPCEKVRFACQLQLLSEEWKKRTAVSTRMYGALKNSSITLQEFP